MKPTPLMFYTSIELESDFFLFWKNGGLTGDVLERCKNKWSYGGHDNSGQVQAIRVKQTKLVSLVQKLGKYVAVFKNIHF